MFRLFCHKALCLGICTALLLALAGCSGGSTPLAATSPTATVTSAPSEADRNTTQPTAQTVPTVAPDQTALVVNSGKAAIMQPESTKEQTESVSSVKPAPSQQSQPVKIIEPAATPTGSSTPDASSSVSLQASSAPTETKVEVQISIIGDKEKGTILEVTSLEFHEGDSVIDVLKNITKAKKIQMETRGKGSATYVEGISNLYEFDKGSKSGWLYSVNDKFPNVSAGAYKVKKGDRIQWFYTLDLGKDVGKTE